MQIVIYHKFFVQHEIKSKIQISKSNIFSIDKNSISSKFFNIIIKCIKFIYIVYYRETWQYLSYFKSFVSFYLLTFVIKYLYFFDNSFWCNLFDNKFHQYVLFQHINWTRHILIMSKNWSKQIFIFEIFCQQFFFSSSSQFSRIFYRYSILW